MAVARDGREGGRRRALDQVAKRRGDLARRVAADQTDGRHRSGPSTGGRYDRRLGGDERPDGGHDFGGPLLVGVVAGAVDEE